MMGKKKCGGSIIKGEKVAGCIWLGGLGSEFGYTKGRRL